jgi:hypothetical protein
MNDQLLKANGILRGDTTFLPRELTPEERAHNRQVIDDIVVKANAILRGDTANYREPVAGNTQYDRVEKFSEDQARDSNGRWAGGSTGDKLKQNGWKEKAGDGSSTFTHSKLPGQKYEVAHNTGRWTHTNSEGKTFSGLRTSSMTTHMSTGKSDEGEFTKYSEDQPRDDKGRFGSGSGAESHGTGGQPEGHGEKDVRTADNGKSVTMESGNTAAYYDTKSGTYAPNLAGSKEAGHAQIAGNREGTSLKQVGEGRYRVVDAKGKNVGKYEIHEGKVGTDSKRGVYFSHNGTATPTKF